MKIHIAIIAACAGGLILSQAHLAQAQVTPKDQVLVKEPTGSGMVAAASKTAIPLAKQDQPGNTSRSNTNR